MTSVEPPAWVVVTGASRGIGRATSLKLAEAGWNVLVHARSRLDLAEQTCDRVRHLGRQARTLILDLSDHAQIPSFVDQAWKLPAPPTAWVHNAGVDLLTGDAASLPFEEKLRQAIEVDLVGSMLTCRAVGRKMLEHPAGGSIVTIGWDQSETGMEGDSGEIFGAVKGAITCFSRSLARSLAPKVRVNCVAPGWIQTAWGEQASDYWQQRVKAETPLERWGTPDDVAATITFLLSKPANFLTGQTIRVNGGVVRQ